MRLRFVGETIAFVLLDHQYFNPQSVISQNCEIPMYSYCTVQYDDFVTSEIDQLTTKEIYPISIR